MLTSGKNIVSVFGMTLLSSTFAWAASMSYETVNGKISDTRISECGVRVLSGESALIVPFLKATSDFDGSYEIAVTKRSSSGSSQTRQANRIQGGTIGSAQVAVDVPSQVQLEMTVRDRSGQSACVLERTFDFSAKPLKI